MDYPSWITAPNLGSFPQDQGFNLSPLVISFSAATGSSVSLLNGNLPLGLSWERVANTIEITGVAIPSPLDITGRFTFRIRQPNGAIADRTFSLVLVSLPLLPVWETDTFLGYQGTDAPSTYALRAIPPPGKFVSYSIISGPVGMSIDAFSGILSYDASSITVDTVVSLTVRASTDDSYSDLDMTISVVTPSTGPRWVTSPGNLGTFAGGDFIDINLEATEVSGAPVSYTLVSVPIDFPLEINAQTGLLYGRVPNPTSEMIYAFQVLATSDEGSSAIGLSLRVLPSELFSPLTWDTMPDLGTINEGGYVEIPLKASTTRRTTIIYSATGGLLPPHLMLEKTAGRIVGYCEYHAVDKTYYFDVSATDGYQTVTRRFKLSVKKIYNDQFFGAYIPLTGDLRDLWAQEAYNARTRDPGTVIFEGLRDIEDPPVLNIINGVVTGYMTPDEIFSQADPWLHTLGLQLGKTGNSVITGTARSMVYRSVVDQQDGANLSVYSSAVQNTNVQTDGLVTPISIENMRRSLRGDLTLVGGGSGSGLGTIPVIDWSDGSLQRVIVSSPGNGYRSRPELRITGSGRGAKATAILGLVGIEITDPGQGWSVGDEISMPGNHDSSPAVLLVSQVGTNGSLVSVEIANPGDYLQVSSAGTQFLSSSTGSAIVRPSWGIASILVEAPGAGYQCGISISSSGSEVLPPWQDQYFPAIAIGSSRTEVAQQAADYIDAQVPNLRGTKWEPNYMVFQWQGVRWFGSTTFDSELTTFDGASTRFEEAESPINTVFDGMLSTFDDGLATFDRLDPLEYDIFNAWGGTLIDSGTTVFDLYSTIFDMLAPRRQSRTLIRKWIGLQQRIYSGNNAVW